MNLLMVSGDRSLLQEKKGAFWYTLEEFSKHWDRVDIICPGVRGTSDCAVHGNVYVHPSPKRLWYQPWWILKKGKELHKQNAFDVMTVHEYPPFYNGIGARWLSKAISVPYALEIHHIVGWPTPASFAEYLGRILSRFYLAIDASTAAAVRTVNETVKERLIKWDISSEKIQVVPSFYLDRELLSSIPEQQEEYDIAFCARLVENKGVKELLDAVTLLEGVRLVVIGDGPERSLMEKRAKQNGIADRVTFTGWLSTQEEVMKTIKSAKMFVMNSKSEGGPRVLLEAMACGMPVVSTPVGIAQTVIRVNENGVLSTGSAQNLGFRIQTLLKDEGLRSTLGKNAQEVLKQFDRPTLVKAYADFLKNIS